MIEERFLLIHTGGIGDLIMARPAIQFLKRKRPDALLDFMGNPVSLSILINTQELHSLIPFQSAKKNLWSAFSVLKILVLLRLRRYERLYLLQPILGADGHKRLRFLVKFINARRNYGRESPFDSDFVDYAVRELSTRHEVDRMLAVVSDNHPPPVQEKDYLLSFPVDDNYKKYGLQEHAYIVLSPGGNKSFRRWPIDNFMAIAHLAVREGLNIVLIGSPSEQSILAENEKMLPKGTKNLIGKTDFSSLCSVIQHAKLVVANDSGPMHLANALGTPVVCIFGSGDRVRTPPFLTDKARLLDSPALECKPCYRQVCDAPLCMIPITVEKVWNATKSLL